MKSARLCALLLVVTLSGCSLFGTVRGPLRPVDVPALPEPAAAPVSAPPAEPAPQRIRVLPPHLDPDSELYQHRSVYFAFDDWLLRAVDQPVIDSHGTYLWRYPELSVRVEGHTDDRGGREYNLALGERRAQAVKAAMQLLGARDEQIETVSYGEEKPRSPGTGEASRAANRRADIIYRRDAR